MRVPAATPEPPTDPPTRRVPVTVVAVRMLPSMYPLRDAVPGPMEPVTVAAVGSVPTKPAWIRAAADENEVAAARLIEADVRRYPSTVRIRVPDRSCSCCRVMPEIVTVDGYLRTSAS